MRLLVFTVPRLIVAALMLALGTGLAGAVPKHKPQADEEWVTYKNPRFGYSLYYPSAYFQRSEAPENGNGLTFTSEDGQAKIVVFGVRNTENLTPKEYRRVLLDEFGGYDQLDYSPVGKTWFVLSGFRGDNIYYQKVMFTCSNELISVFSMTFPTADKPFYEGLIETMEDNFRAGRGGDGTVSC